MAAISGEIPVAECRIVLINGNNLVWQIWILYISYGARGPFVCLLEPQLKFHPHLIAVRSQAFYKYMSLFFAYSQSLKSVVGPILK